MRTVDIGLLQPIAVFYFNKPNNQIINPSFKIHLERIQVEASLNYIILNAIAVFNIALLSGFLILRKNNTKPNYFLAIIFLIPGLYFVDNLIIWTECIYTIPFSFFSVQIIANLFPITVYKYVQMLTSGKKRFPPFLAIGSILSTLYSFGLLYYFYQLNAEEQNQYISQLSTGNYPESMNIYNLLFYACQMCYLVVVFIQIRNYEIKVLNNLTDTDSVKISFIKRFIFLLGSFNFIVILSYILLPIAVVDYGLLPIVMTILYMFTIFFSIQNNAIFSTQSYHELLDKNEEMSENEEETNAVLESANDPRWQKSIDTLQNLLEKEKVYKKQNLNLRLLSELADEQPYFISQILNKHYQKSFFDYINEIRVEEAKEQLKSFNIKIDTIEKIAFEVGFNSRASFYRSFKKVTGKNPHDFVSTP